MGISLHVRGRTTVYLDSSFKMILKLKFQHFFLVTFCLTLSKVKSVQLNIGCWPSNINSGFLSKDGLSETSANKKMNAAIEEDPGNTICEKAWWFLYGWTIKCTREPFNGIDCGSGTHVLVFNREYYFWADSVFRNVNEEICGIIFDREKGEEAVKKNVRCFYSRKKTIFQNVVSPSIGKGEENDKKN